MLTAADGLCYRSRSCLRTSSIAYVCDDTHRTGARPDRAFWPSGGCVHFYVAVVPGLI